MYKFRLCFFFIILFFFSIMCTLMILTKSQEIISIMFCMTINGWNMENIYRIVKAFPSIKIICRPCAYVPCISLPLRRPTDPVPLTFTLSSNQCVSVTHCDAYVINYFFTFFFFLLLNSFLSISSIERWSCTFFLEKHNVKIFVVKGWNSFPISNFMSQEIFIDCLGVILFRNDFSLLGSFPVRWDIPRVCESSSARSSLSLLF